MENKLTAPSAKELYFKASLLYLCNDVYCRLTIGFCGMQYCTWEIFR